MNEQLLRELNENIKRLLNYLEPDEDAVIRHAAEQALRGNWKPVERYAEERRGE